jgi:hypothetical protein
MSRPIGSNFFSYVVATGAMNLDLCKENRRAYLVYVVFDYRGEI